MICTATDWQCFYPQYRALSHARFKYRVGHLARQNAHKTDDASAEDQIHTGCIDNHHARRRAGAERIVTFAYELAVREGRKKVTAMHKANILKSTSGLFLDVAREVAARYPQIESEEMIIDAACMNLVMYPEKFDVIVTTNLFGDIISDLCAGLVGGLGMAPGANIGQDIAIFEAVHGSAPDIAGKNIANPTSVFLAAVQMLEHLKMQEQAHKIAAVRKTIAEGKNDDL